MIQGGNLSNSKIVQRGNPKEDIVILTIMQIK